jgi:hypothetical protein
MQKIKTIVLGLVSLALWVADWWAVKETVYATHSLIFWIWPSAITVLAISISVFFLLVNKNRLYSILWAVAGAVGYFLIMPKDIYVALGGIIFLGLAYLFEMRIWSEEKNTLNFSLRRIISNSVSVMVYCLLLILGFNIYHAAGQDFAANPDAYYEKLGQAASRTVPYFSKALPDGVDFNQTFDDFVTTQAAKDHPEIEQIPASQRNQLLDQYRSQFFDQFQVKASGNESLSDIFAQIAVDKIKTSSKGYEQYFPFVFAISVVSLLWLFAFVLRWAILLVSWLLFQVLLTLKFFTITKVPVEVDKLTV